MFVKTIVLRAETQLNLCSRTFFNNLIGSTSKNKSGGFVAFGICRAFVNVFFLQCHSLSKTVHFTMAQYLSGPKGTFMTGV